MINKRIENHAIDNFIIINPIKQQIFSLPKEESQMFSSKEKSWTESSTYTNNPNSETENRTLLLANNSPLNASWNATDYIGLSTYRVPYNIDPLFCDISITYLVNNVTLDYDTTNLTNITRGVQSLRLPATYLDVEFVEDDETDFTNKYGEYVISIRPKYVETNLVNILNRKHFPINDLEDGDGINRRTIYEVDASSFNVTPWAFNLNNKQSGRLIGSVVEILSSDGVVKQTKIIAENDLNELDEVVKLVLTPDNVGYDSPYEEIEIGDIFRIYPRETYFEDITILMNYISSVELAEQAYKYMMNDVVRDMTTGIYEIYDKNGFVVNADGTFSGTVIQKYQIQQIGQYELRKRITES